MSGHHCHHHPAPQSYNRAFAIGIGLNLGFVVIEVVAGFWASSMALVADAGHNFSDVLSLLLAWGASFIATQAASTRRTYGFRRATILASLFSALLLLITMGAMTWESIQRLQTQYPIQSQTMIVVALMGVIINTLTALMFMRGQKHDLNLKAAYLHMAADAAVSVGVVAAGIAIYITGWNWLDPAISLLIVLVILYGTWGLLRDSLNLAMDSVPEHIDPDQIRQELLAFETVTSLHDLHIWAMSTTETALTVHLIVHQPASKGLLEQISQHLQQAHGIAHATIQIENQDQSCSLENDTCIPRHHH